MLTDKSIHLIHGGIAYISDGIVVFPFEIVYLKRQDRIKAVDVAPDIFDTPLLPSPDFRGDIIEHRADLLRVNKARDGEIKARIVHQYDHIWPISSDLLFALPHPAQDSASVEQYRNKTHISQVFVVAQASRRNGLHIVSTIILELGFGIFSLQSFHQMGRV